MQLFYQLTRAKLLFFLLRSCSNGNISHRHTTLEPDRSFVADCYQLKKIRRHRNGWVAKRGRGCLETPWKRPQISETSKNFTIEQHARATIWKLDKCQFMHRWCMPSSVNSSILHKLLACASVANLNIILAPRPIYNSALVPIKGNTVHRAQQDQQPEHGEREKKGNKQHEREETVRRHHRWKSIDLDGRSQYHGMYTWHQSDLSVQMRNFCTKIIKNIDFTNLEGKLRKWILGI